MVGDRAHICGDSPNVKITAARDSHQVFVLAPLEVQDQIARRLAEKSGELATTTLPGEAAAE